MSSLSLLFASRPLPLPAPVTAPPAPLLGWAGLDRRGDIGEYVPIIGVATYGTSKFTVKTESFNLQA